MTGSVITLPPLDARAPRQQRAHPRMVVRICSLHHACTFGLESNTCSLPPGLWGHPDLADLSRTWSSCRPPCVGVATPARRPARRRPAGRSSSPRSVAAPKATVTAQSGLPPGCARPPAPLSASRPEGRACQGSGPAAEAAEAPSNGTVTTEHAVLWPVPLASGRLSPSRSVSWSLCWLSRCPPTSSSVSCAPGSATTPARRRGAAHYANGALGVPPLARVHHRGRHAALDVRLDPVTGAEVVEALDPSAEQLWQNDVGDAQRRPGRAPGRLVLLEACRRAVAVDPTGQPTAGGGPTLLLLIDHQTLQCEPRRPPHLPACRRHPALPRHRPPAGLQRRPPPVVLDGASQPLDLGRSRRFPTRAQRLALLVRDGPTCVFPGCDRPISWTNVHDLVPWEHGGATNLLTTSGASLTRTTTSPTKAAGSSPATRTAGSLPSAPTARPSPHIHASVADPPRPRQILPNSSRCRDAPRP